MVYGLILSVGIGASTLVSTYNTQVECSTALAMIGRNPIQSAICIPGDSKEDLQNKVKELNGTIANTTIRTK